MKYILESKRSPHKVITINQSQYDLLIRLGSTIKQNLQGETIIKINNNPFVIKIDEIEESFQQFNQELSLQTMLKNLYLKM